MPTVEDYRAHIIAATTVALGFVDDDVEPIDWPAPSDSAVVDPARLEAFISGELHASMVAGGQVMVMLLSYLDRYTDGQEPDRLGWLRRAALECEQSGEHL